MTLTEKKFTVEITAEEARDLAECLHEAYMHFKEQEGFHPGMFGKLAVDARAGRNFFGRLIEKSWCGKDA